MFEPLKVPVGVLKDQKRKLIKRVTLEQENLNARYLKIKVKNTGQCPEWHPAAGRKAWLFIDEITVN